MRSRRLTFAFFSLLAHGLHCTAPDVQIRICLFVLVEESSPLVVLCMGDDGGTSKVLFSFASWPAASVIGRFGEEKSSMHDDLNKGHKQGPCF